MNEWMSKWVSAWMSECVSDEWMMNEWVSDWMSDEWVSDWMSEWVSTWMSEWIKRSTSNGSSWRSPPSTADSWGWSVRVNRASVPTPGMGSLWPRRLRGLAGGKQGEWAWYFSSPAPPSSKLLLRVVAKAMTLKTHRNNLAIIKGQCEQVNWYFLGQIPMHTSSLFRVGVPGEHKLHDSGSVLWQPFGGRSFFLTCSCSKVEIVLLLKRNPE